MACLAHWRATFIRNWIGVALYLGGVLLPSFALGESPKEPPKEVATDLQSEPQAYLLNTGEDALRARLDLIGDGSDEILLSTFIFKSDESGLAILARLREYRRRTGRPVRLLVDHFGNKLSPAMMAYLQREGIEIRTYQSRKNAGLVGPMFFGILHEKMLIQDQKRMILGSRNIHKRYFDRSDPQAMVDREIVLDDPSSVEAAREHFYYLWNHARVQEPLSPSRIISDAVLNQVERQLDRAAEKLPVGEWGTWEDVSISIGHARFVGDRVGESGVKTGAMRELISMIDETEKLITIETPYLVLAKELRAALESARARGVEIQLFTNSLKTNNQLLTHIAYEKEKAKLSKLGIRIWERVARGTLHAKTVVVDGKKTFLGSVNFNGRSAHPDQESGMIIEGQAFANHVESDLVSEHFMDSKEAGPRPFGGGIRRFLSGCLNSVFLNLVRDYL